MGGWHVEITLFTYKYKQAAFTLMNKTAIGHLQLLYCFKKHNTHCQIGKLLHIFGHGNLLNVI